MLLKPISFLLLLTLIICDITAQTTKKFSTEEYVTMYKDIAIKEMHTYGIPASITLSQGILESSSGNSRLALEGNNHFGIKCKSDWTGKTIYADDDAPEECFRAYASALESFKDHSEFLKNNWRYQELFKLPVTDYKGWADGLRKAGYATNPKYHELLINLIDRYQLAQYDYAPKPGQAGLVLEIKNNDIPAVYAQGGETVSDIAKRNDLPVNRVYKWNDLPKGAPISEGDILYLKPKKRKGSAEEHLVQPGETMYEISQMYGIQIKHLYRKNRMETGEQPAPGEKLYMQQKRDKDDPVKKADPISQPKSAPAVKDTLKTTFINPNSIPVTKEEPMAELPDYHIVQSGDNIYRIAEKYHVLEEDLIKWNHLNALQLQLGQKIYLKKEVAEKQVKKPEIQQNTPKIETVRYHMVKEGDTVYRICTMYKISADQLAKWNQLKGNEIYIGQKLRVSE